MFRTIAILFLGLIAIFLVPASSRAQSLSDPATDRMGTVTFTLDGKTHTSGVKAYMVDDRLFLNGIWVEDSTVKFGRAGLASTFLLRVNGSVGNHTVAATAENGTGSLLSLLYGGTASGRMYEILRSDGAGGNGTVTVNRLTDHRAEGTFEFTAYNKDNPSQTKNVAGRFDVDFKKIGGEEGE